MKEEADLDPKGYLKAADHIKSLLYIEKLRGQKIDSKLVGKLKRTIDKIEKSGNEFKRN
ncbi:MAG: Archaellum protein FlaD/E [Candidatus Methanohalarchaeum thermophilum]|uniref:Archaellum protein FlaD/E n=1 Tax=Methanohalarchaeum thermophilum TaxID=1903181 RepID=A0A1Q6DXL5_METT1|nr:MAG: Archaellum protein FlaD/E [Candidatus Methanohalarchaeum thermophilum]